MNIDWDAIEAIGRKAEAEAEAERIHHEVVEGRYELLGLRREDCGDQLD